MDIYLGTIANAVCVLLGGVVGLLVRSHLRDNYREIAIHCLGLFTIFIGLKMAFDTQNVVIVVVSLITGALLGEWINIEKRLGKFGEWIRARLVRGSSNSQFVEGFVTASIVFCVGSMTIVGCIESGVKGDHTIIYTKSIMDGVFTVTLTSTLGIGAMFSIIPILIYQGGLTALAASVAQWMTEPVIAAMSGVGGILILGIGLNFLGMTKIRAGNLLPSLFIAALMAGVFS